MSQAEIFYLSIFSMAQRIMALYRFLFFFFNIYKLCIVMTILKKDSIMVSCSQFCIHSCLSPRLVSNQGQIVQFALLLLLLPLRTLAIMVHYKLLTFVALNKFCPFDHLSQTLLRHPFTKVRQVGKALFSSLSLTCFRSLL